MSRPIPTEPFNPGPGWEFVSYQCNGPGHRDAKRCPSNTRTNQKASWVKIDSVTTQIKDRGSYSLVTTSPFTKPDTMKNKVSRIIVNCKLWDHFINGEWEPIDPRSQGFVWAKRACRI